MFPLCFRLLELEFRILFELKSTFKMEDMCRPPLWEIIVVANFARWSNFKRPRGAS